MKYCAIDTRKSTPDSKVWLGSGDDPQELLRAGRIYASRRRKDGTRIMPKDGVVKVYELSPFLQKDGGIPKGRRFYIQNGVLYSNFERNVAMFTKAVAAILPNKTNTAEPKGAAR